MGFVDDKTIQSPSILTFFSGESHGQRSLASYCPCGRKELDTTERVHVYKHAIWLVFVIFLLQMEKEVSLEFNDF